MIEYTQSDTTHGDCWQTALACIIDTPPERLPPQVEIEQWPTRALGGWGSYRNVMNGYLRTHMGMEYSQINRPSFSAVVPIYEYHVICGPSVRTPTTKRNHCVVAHLGREVWDPHPSRAGLTEHQEWGVIGDYIDRPPSQMRQSNPELYDLVFGCLCPSCGLDRARQVAANYVEPDEGSQR